MRVGASIDESMLDVFPHAHLFSPRILLQLAHEVVVRAYEVEHYAEENQDKPVVLVEQHAG